MPFNPAPGEPITIDNVTYAVAGHPAAPSMPYGQEGRAAIVFQLVAGVEKRALKVFKPRFRVPGLVMLAEQITPFSSMPGLAVSRRTVLTPQRDGELLRQFPDLLYAVLMPWIEGPTWMELVVRKQALTPEQCLKLGRTLAHILAEMEQCRLGHSDLSGANLILPALVPSRQVNTAAPRSGVELVDVEQLYAPGLEKPETLPTGSSGYAHKTAVHGIWSSNSDRFSGAILLSEILGWCDPHIQEAAWGESYFEPGEIQQDSSRLVGLTRTLETLWGNEVALLFDRAWQSDTLADCPTFGEWLVKLPHEVPMQHSPNSTVLPTGLANTQGAQAKTGVEFLVGLAKHFEQQGRTEAALTTYQYAQTLIPTETALWQELSALQHNLSASNQEPEQTATGQASKPTPLGALLHQHAKRDIVRVSQLGRGTINSLAASPDGTCIAIGSSYGIYMYETTNYELVTFIECNTGISSVAFSTDGRRLAASGSSGVIQVWRVYDTELLYELKGHTANAWSVAFSCDDRWLGSGGSDATVRVWDLEDGSCTQELDVGGGTVWTVKFSPVSALLAAGSEDGVTRVWDTSEGTLIYELSDGTDAIWSLSFSAGGKRLATGSRDGSIRTWRLEDGALRRRLDGHSGSVEGLAFSPNGMLLASGAWDNTVRLWNARNGAVTGEFEEHVSPISSVEFSPDGKLVASGGHDGVVKIMDTVSYDIVGELTGFSGALGAVAFIADGRIVASGSQGGTVRLWRVRDGVLIHEVQGHSGSVLDVECNSDGTMIASAGDDGNVLVWDVNNGNLIYRLEGHEGGAQGISISPDGRVLASSDGQGVICLWDLDDGGLIREFGGSGGSVAGLSFSPDSELLATGGDDNMVRIWEAGTGALLHECEGHSDGVPDVAFSPDWAFLASGSLDGTVRLWRTYDGGLIRALTCGAGGIESGAFAPDGTLLASGGTSGTLDLWDVRNGSLLTELEGHRGAVTGLIFNLEGTLLASASDDGTIGLWGFSNDTP